MFLGNSYVSMVYFCLVTKTMIVNGFQQLPTRYKRYLPLIYPPTSPTRIQWIIGFGIPLEDLQFEALTTGYVLKAEYWLPDNVERLRTKGSIFIKGRNYNYNNNNNNNDIWPAFGQFNNETLQLRTNHILSNFRWELYKVLENLGNRFNMDGHICLLKSICEANIASFHPRNGIVADLLKILLTPSTSKDLVYDNFNQQYLEAEANGNSGANCDFHFTNCKRSMLSYFASFY